ncbi:uncharacterized protein LOC128394030 [Panonychus citri]|uniref:uncharacterized protein LOC128394030 n=1 Tax=Panonychus citri TaxID=50023 RepID=UPI0023072797|nr:uncharacterized protein LOC128394030 [Panonychus citri]
MTTTVSRCVHCNRKFKKQINLKFHQQLCASVQVSISRNLNVQLPGEFLMKKQAFYKSLNVYYKKFNENFFDIETVLKTESGNLKQLLTTFLKSLGMLKVQIGLSCEFYRYDGFDIVWIDPMFNSSLKPLTSIDLYNHFLDECYFEISLDFDSFNQKGSGWILNKVKSLEVRIGKYIPYRGGCKKKQLPPFILSKRAIIQLDSSVDCFMWSVIAAVHPVQKNACRLSHYKKYQQQYNFDGYKGYVKLDRIKFFEKKNSISVNVYTFTVNKKKFLPIPLYVSKERLEQHANLLLYDEHYWPIRNFNRFIGSKDSRYHNFCENCFTGFLTSQKCSAHTKDCYQFKPSRVETPPVNTKIFFTQFEKMIKYPFIIYADFETLCQPVDSGENRNTFEYQEHIPSSFGYVIVNNNGKILKYESHRGADSGLVFLQSLNKSCEKILNALKNRFSQLRMSTGDQKLFDESTQCHICENDFNIDDVKVRDHDHFTGLYRGAAHDLCNLQMKVPVDIPVVFHNLKNFDAHILIKAIQDRMYDHINIIPQNTEKYISFSFDKLKFIDSYAFLSGSLDVLAQDLGEAFKNSFLLQVFKDEDINFVSAKASLPYDYLDSFDRFNEIELPPYECFYNKLKRENIEKNVYQNMVNLWNHFHVKNMGEFQDIYQKIDVILLAAVFENFRSISIEQFKLDPPHFYSAPGLSWAAALKSTKVKIDLLTDIDMIMLFERGIRGGISSASKRYEKANIPDTSDFISNEKPKFITYLDVNNLYGYALQQALPMSDFKFVDNVEFDSVYQLCINEKNPNSDIGYVFEVDLDYPSHLHDLHKDYPLAPDRVTIDQHHLSKLQLSILETTERPRTKCEKLIATFFKREKYVIHQRNLQFYVKHGLIVTKIHRIVSFKQSCWLKDYIMLCTRKRMVSKSNFEKNFWKLLVNAIYGKSIEDVRKHSEIKLETSLDGAMKQMQKPLVERFFILDEHKALFKMRRKSVLLNKPIFAGFTVLEISKLHMYQLHYEIFKVYYGDNIELLYTDTDSFIYSIKTNNLYNDFNYLSDIFDFSDYPSEHQSGLKNDNHKKKLGYLKDEMNGKNILEFIALKSKVYCLKTDETVKKTAKGVQKAVLKKMITFDDYKTSLDSHNLLYHEMRSLRSFQHNIKSIQSRKLALNPFDDKRYLLENGVDTLPFGHYSTT